MAREYPVPTTAELDALFEDKSGKKDQPEKKDKSDQTDQQEKKEGQPS